MLCYNTSASPQPRLPATEPPTAAAGHHCHR